MIKNIVFDMGTVLTNLHCLQRMRTPFELQNDFSVAILGLSKIFGRMPQ